MGVGKDRAESGPSVTYSTSQASTHIYQEGIRSVSVRFVSFPWPFRFDSFPLPGCFGSTRFLNISSRFGPFRPEPGRFVSIRFL